MNWQQVLNELRRHYKPIAQIAREVGMKAKTLQQYARYGTDKMLYEPGQRLVDLHKAHVGQKKGA